MGLVDSMDEIENLSDMKGMKMNRRIFTILAVLVMLVGLLSGYKSKAQAGETSASKIAPDFTLADYDGSNVKLSDYKGKIVVLEWFNYDCPFVKYHYEKTKVMVELANKYKDKNVAWLAINSTKNLTTEKDKDFANKYKLTYPILDDISGKVGRAYKAKTTPQMFIIDTEGKIVYSGAIDNSPMGKAKEDVVNYVDNALAELTAGKAITVPKTKPYGCSVKYTD